MGLSCPFTDVLSLWSWRTKSGISRIICATLYFVLFVLISVSLIFFTRESVCTTSKCKRAAIAATVVERIDFTVNPCDDFYRFACGKFLNKTKISEGQLNVDSFTEIKDKVHEQLKSLLNESYNANDPASFKIAKKLYQQCISKPFQKHGTELIHDIQAKFGLWPKTKQDSLNDASTSNWTYLIKEFRRFGFDTNSIIGLGVEVDLKNSSTYIIYFSQPEFELDREYLVEGWDNKFVLDYYDSLVNIAVDNGNNRTLAEAEVMRTIGFEIELAKISQPKETLRNLSTLHNPLTLRALDKKYPYIKWTEYVNALFPSPLSVNGNEVVVDMTPSYCEALGELLKNTPAHVISNYMLWHAIRSHMKLMSLLEVSSGKNCIDSTSKTLPVLVSAMYVRKYFQRNSKEVAQKMVKEIVLEFRRILKESFWMDKETREKALQKLDAMSTYIGYPDWLMNDSEIEKLYKDLEIDENSYVASLLSINKFTTDHQFRELRKPPKRDDWFMEIPPFGINAGSLLIKNGLQFPAAIFQGQLFSFDRPWYMNFGAIGSIIGHEIAHCFDDQGAQFDFTGEISDWWKPTTKTNFLNRTKCIIEQYGNYIEPMTGRKLNGIVTQGENIADNAGFKVSYLALQQWEKNNGAEPKLPLLNYTSQQMFWISAAQLYCSVSTTNYMDGTITDVHSPNRFRIIGSFSNIEEFVNDFKCPKDSPMNRPNKCKVW